MSLVQLFVPTEVAHDTVSALGELGDVQFKDVRIYVLYLTIFFADFHTAQPEREPFPTVLRGRNTSHRRDGSQSAFLCHSN
jgi:hypothetical protein